MAPAFPEFQELLHVDVAALSSSLMFQYVGVLLGSLTAAYVCDVARRHADLALFAASITAGLLNICAPWAPNLAVLSLIYCLSGVCQAVMDTTCNALTMLERGDESGSPMNLLHAVNALGLVLAPLTVAPFLTHEELQSGRNITFQYYMSTSESSISIPYGIHGSIGVLAGVPFLCFYLCNWTYEELEVTKQGFLSNFRKFKYKFTVIIAVVAFLLTAFMSFRDNAMGLLNFKIAIDKPLKFTKPRAAMYATSYSLCWLLSRILGVFIMKWVSCHLVIFTMISLVILANILLLILGMKSQAYYWVVSCAIPFAVGPYYPTLMAWINDYFAATGAMVASVVTGLGIGGFLTSGISGHLYQYHGPLAVFGEMLAASTMLLIVSIPVQVFFNRRGKRFKKESQEFEIQNVGLKPLTNRESIPLMKDEI